MGEDDWREYRRLIVSKLDDLRGELDAIKSMQQQTRIDLELVKFKVALAGMTAGFFASAVITVVKTVFFDN